MRNIIVVVLFVFSGLTLQAQDYYKLIEKGKYSKVVGKCEKKLEKDPIDVEAMFFLAFIKSRPDAGKFTSCEEAYDYYLKVFSLYNDYYDQIKEQKLEKIPINSEIIKALGDSIFELGLQNAANLNTEDAYIAYLNKYTKATDYFKNRAIEERNRIAYATASSENTIESYNLFIAKYPYANQVKNAWKNIYDLAYQLCEKENTIDAFESYMKKYPESPHNSEAIENIHELAFEVAKLENTSQAYNKYCVKYPKSKYFDSSKSLFYNREFVENTTVGVWESYRNFYENFEGPYKQIALDSIFKFIETDNFEVLNYIIDSKIKVDSLGIVVFNVFKNNFEIGDINGMKKIISKYGNWLDSYDISKYMNIVKEGLGLKLNEPYDKKNKNLYIDFIKKYGDLDLSYIVLQRLISDDLFNYKYEVALKTIESLEVYITNNKSKVVNLKKIIAAKFDKNISALPINELNTFGNEYSPIISADNNVILFCGKDRIDNKSGEDIFISYKKDGKLSKPTSIKELSSYGTNEAPICISIDGNELLLFIDGKIYESIKQKSGWGTPQIIEEINSDYWQGDACISSDNTTLFFARSSRKYEKDSIIEFSNLITEKVVVETGITKDKLVNEYLLGDGISAGNIHISNNTLSYGFFKNGLRAKLPFEAGIILSSGNVNNAAEFNNTSEMSFSNYNNDTKNLRDLIIDEPLFDATELKFDFISVSDTMSFNYVFGSEEYPEFVCSEFNDVFGFFLSGPDPAGGEYNNKNIAMIPNSNTYVSINSINNGIVGENGSLNYCEKIDDNWKDLSVYYNDNLYGEYGWELDGFTDVFSTGAKLIPGKKYTISIAIADVSDDRLDSYVILEKNSFKGITLISNKNTFDNINGDNLPLSDIYISQKGINGKWQKPKRLCSVINTKYTERSPFIHPDMRTLYFSSDGHGGIGKLDVFMSKKLSDTCWDCWSEPLNLGKEINTPNSDWGYKISTDGDVAYFSKDNKSLSREDVYKITLPPNLRPDFVARVEGKIKDRDEKPIATTIHWEDLESNKVIGTSKTDPKDGSYFIVLPMGKNYGYFIEDSSYFPISQNLDLRNETKAVDVSKDIVGITFNDMIEKSIAVPMNNLFFDFGKYNLLPASKPELIRIASIIKKYNLKIEIAGHTDDIGEDKSNYTLSEKRANSVMEFLINQGCSSSLMQTVGYGESKPVVSNDSEENRARNRRVELRFVK